MDTHQPTLEKSSGLDEKDVDAYAKGDIESSHDSESISSDDVLSNARDLVTHVISERCHTVTRRRRRVRLFPSPPLSCTSPRAVPDKSGGTKAKVD